MIGPDLQALLEGGCALIVGTVGPDGAPHASRGWAADVTAPDAVRVVLDGDDPILAAHLAGGARLAVTATDVPTLRSAQLKGRADEVAPVVDEVDLARIRRYCDAFARDILATDGTPTALVARLTPAHFVACRLAVEEVFDQTPGPAAGAPLP